MHGKGAYELPLCTVVYISAHKVHPIVWRTELEAYTYRFVKFVYDPHDGLWATKYTRKVWGILPDLHPHCTLFQHLYKNLEL
jgi:hypothetical protein